MNIAYDAKRFFHNKSGLGNYARDLVRIMAQAYPQHNFMLLDKKLSEQKKIVEQFKNVQCIKPNIPCPAWRQIGMAKTAQNYSAQILHGLSGELPIFYNTKPIKKIVTICDVIFERYPQYYSAIDRKIHFKKFVHACKIADKIVAISTQTKLDCVEFLNADPQKIEVIYVPCHNAFKQVCSPELMLEVKNKFVLPEKFILSVGTIEERKNLLKTVEAIANNNIHLIVVGKETQYAQTVKDFISKNNMQNRVHFLQNVNMQELSVIYKCATALVYISVFEGFGIPLVEALYSGTPIITNKQSCFPEIAGPQSIFVDVENSAEIRTAIEKIYSDKELHLSMAQQGLQLAQRYNDEVIAKQYAMLYDLK